MSGASGEAPGVQARFTSPSAGAPHPNLAVVLNMAPPRCQVPGVSKTRLGHGAQGTVWRGPQRRSLIASLKS